MIGIYSTHALQRAVRRADCGAHRSPLTDCEREVMRWVAIGKTDDEIATILSISRTTATTHVENAKEKLNAPRRAQAIVQALRYGEITL